MAQQLVPLPAGVELVERSEWERQRREPRFHCGLAMAGIIATTQPPTSRQGWVLNLSSRGAGVLLPHPLDAGTLLVLQLKSTAGDRRYDLPGRVAHSTLQPSGDWLIGCQFADSLTEDDLDALL